MRTDGRKHGRTKEYISEKKVELWIYISVTSPPPFSENHLNCLIS